MKDLKNWRYTLYCHYSLMKITSLHSWRTIFGALPKRTFHKDVIAVNFQELSFGQTGFEKCTYGVVYVYVHEFD